VPSLSLWEGCPHGQVFTHETKFIMSINAAAYCSKYYPAAKTAHRHIDNYWDRAISRVALWHTTLDEYGQPTCSYI
jgi:hypothetical protein